MLKSIFSNYWWIPCAIVMYSAYAWTTIQNNLHKTKFWFATMFVVGAIPLWNFASRHSKHIILDGFIYDLVIILSYVGTMILLGKASGFKINQWIGLLMCLLGIILMKIKL